MRFRYIIFCLFLVLTFVCGLPQPVQCSEDNEVDKLLLELSDEENDAVKVDILLKLAEKTSWTDVKSSERYARQALILSQQIDYKKGLAYANFWLAKIYVSYEFDLTESLALESLELAKSTNDSILIAKVYNVMGNLKYALNHYEDALVYYNRSLDIYLAHKQDSASASIYNNLGILRSEMFGDSLSIDYYLKAAEINKKTKNYFWLAINYVNLGFDYIEFGNLQKAFDYLQKSNDIIEERDFNRLYPWLYNNFSYYYSSLNDHDKAIDFANNALFVSKDQGNQLQERDALTRLKESYFNMSDFENAYRYAELIKIVSDSINKHDRLKEIDLLEMRFKFEEEREAQKLELALMEAQHYSKERTYILIILFAAIISFTFLILFILQRNRISRKNLEQKTILLEKEKLTRDLEYKNKELTTNVMYSIEKNKVLTDITEELLEIENTSVKEETRNAIQKISRRINQFVDAKAWEEFEIRFQQVHTEFYESLAAKHPDLTPNEKRLCAFLRLEMSSKEISRITGQSISALQVARTRLRKKLGISNKDINLISFLSQF